MKFSEAISGPIFAADAPDITVVASSSADINITVVCSDTKWQLTMTPVSSSDGYTAVIRTKEILASLIEPRGIDASDGAVPEISISANNGAEPEISMSFQTLYGSAAGKTPAYMARHWLTWRDQVSQTLLKGRERLTFVAGLYLLGWQSGTYKVAAKIYKSSGSVSVELASGALAEEANYYALDASLSTIAAAASLAESAVLAYDMSFSLSGTDSTGTAATLQSYPLRMVVATGETRLKEFAFINSFGVEDRVISYGATQNSLSGGSSTFVNRGSELEISNDAQSQWEVQSGRIASSRGAELWSEFLQSAQRYLATSGAMRLIVIDEFDTDISEGELSSVSFKYHLGEQIKGSYFEDDESIGEYDPAQRYGALVVGDVPEAVTPPSEDLFFLKTRLDDFPLVSLSENYLFLVQSPVSYHWGAASLKSIKNWLQGVVQEDIKGITEDLYGLHKALEEAMSAIDAEMGEMEDAISRMNDDSVFNMSEKGQIRTLWENINGIASLVDVGAGTYQQALQLAEESGATTGEQTEIIFNKNRLLFSGEALRWWVSGVSALEAAFYSLRDYLIDVNLYLNTDTAGFDREHLARLFTAYYRAEQALVAYAQSCYATGILQNFIQGEYKEDLEAVNSQLDKKAETWYQSSAPSLEWDTDEKRAEHLGDIWLNTTADANGNTHAYVYRLKDGDYGWEELNGVPEDVFDMADGKASIYVSKPSSYKKNDLWILESAYTLDGTSYAAGTIVVAVRDASSWSAADWTKRDRYTDDSALTTFISDTYTPYAAEVSKQLDAKANTYAQSSDPAAAWASTEAKELHIGDLWLNTSKSSVSGVGSMKTAIYTKSGSTYGWVVSDVPNELFDDIDGKSSIYVAQPTSYNARDMWILEADRTLNGTAYRKGTILIATATSQSFNAAHWVKRDAYIDTADLKSAVDDIDGELAQLKAGLEEINDDTILDTSEKGYIRTSWEAVNGLATTDQVGTDGSYTKTKAIVDGVGATDETVSLTFAKVAMTYNGVTIDWHYTGVAELDTAFLSLRQFLRDVNLYSNINKTSFDREEMAQLFTRYYDAVQNLLDRAQKKYTDDGIGDVKQSINDFINGEYSEYKKDVQTQLDSKAETWYQATDPSTAWTTAELKAQHKGDIWRNTSSATVSGVESGLDAIWNGSSWDMQSVPSEVYDKIDGKAAIYVEWGSWGSGLRVKDIFIPAADTTQSGVTYKKDAFYRCTATNPATFEELKYTDDSALADFDYLKQAMTDGAATEIGEGVVLSQVIGVKDAGTDNIVAGMNGSSTIEALNDADKGRLMIWAGSKNVAGAKGAVTKIWENGEVESSKFKAISGTFRTLTCVDNEGNVMGAIRFDSSGCITFEGDLYMQGSVSGRSGRFRMSDVWVRGSFGSAERNTLKIVGGTAYFYTKGVSKTPVTVALESIQTTQDVTVYKVPGYFISSGATGATEGGFPVDTIVFRPITGTYYYELELSDTQRVLLVNAKDDTTDNSVYVYSNGSAVLLTGGVVREAIKLETFLNPTVASTIIGVGLLLGAEYDNTWH